MKDNLGEHGPEQQGQEWQLPTIDEIRMDEVVGHDFANWNLIFNPADNPIFLDGQRIFTANYTDSSGNFWQFFDGRLELTGGSFNNYATPDLLVADLFKGEYIEPKNLYADDNSSFVYELTKNEYKFWVNITNDENGWVVYLNNFCKINAEGLKRLPAPITNDQRTALFEAYLAEYESIIHRLGELSSGYEQDLDPETDNLHSVPGLSVELKARLIFLAETLADINLPMTDRPNRIFTLSGEESEEYKRRVAEAFASTYESQIDDYYYVSLVEVTLNDLVDDDRRVELINNINTELVSNPRRHIVLFVGEQLDDNEKTPQEFLFAGLGMITAMSPRVVCFVSENGPSVSDMYFQPFIVDKPDYIGRRELLVAFITEQYFANDMSFFPDLEDVAHLDEFSERTEGMGYEQLRRIVASAFASYALSPTAPRFIDQMYSSIVKHST